MRACSGIDDDGEGGVYEISSGSPLLPPAFERFAAQIIITL